MFSKSVLLAGAATFLVGAVALAQTAPQATAPQGSTEIKQIKRDIEKKLDVVRPVADQLLIRLIPGLSQRVHEDNRTFSLAVHQPFSVQASSAHMKQIADGDPHILFSLPLKHGKTYPIDIEIWKRPNGGAGDLVVNCGPGQDFRFAVTAHNMGVEDPLYFKFELRPQIDGHVNCTLRADPSALSLSQYVFRAISLREL